jgi:hypothetical protein
VIPLTPRLKGAAAEKAHNLNFINVDNAVRAVPCAGYETLDVG